MILENYKQCCIISSKVLLHVLVPVDYIEVHSYTKLILAKEILRMSSIPKITKKATCKQKLIASILFCSIIILLYLALVSFKSKVKVGFTVKAKIGLLSCINLDSNSRRLSTDIVLSPLAMTTSSPFMAIILQPTTLIPDYIQSITKMCNALCRTGFYTQK